jgi:sterol desaturase/sphingolipid hydroxylase (fatty acid hydroxylase superfamily)
VGLLFRANAAVVSGHGATTFLNLFFHMNVPGGLGRGWFLPNSPHYHRVHHSALPRHFNKNYAGMFPIFDVIFRTAHRPQEGEFPPTGLDDGDAPRDVIEAIVWPLRGHMRAQP